MAETTTGWVDSFLGGLNIPGNRGAGARFNATMPLARLRVAVDRLELRCGPPLSRLPGLAAPRAEVAACFRLRPVPVLAHGIGFALANGDVAYFWTFRPGAVLARLRELGWPVEEGRRPYGLLRYLGLKR